MAAKTATEIYQALDAGIFALASGAQSYTIDGVTYTKANLRDMKTVRDMYKAEADAATVPVIQTVNFSGVGYS